MRALKQLLTVTLLLAVCAGLWISFHYTFAAYSLDGDTAVFPMLWHGWREHGFAFFRTWRFTQDNWLLSPAPFVFFIYYIFGVTGYTVLGLGWVFFVINAVLLAVLIRFLSGRWSAASLVALCLGLFASQSAIKDGYLAYVVCHNSSMAWAFIAFISAAYAIEKHNKINAFTLGAIVFLAGVSDPWFNAACTLPIVMVLLALCIKKRQYRRPALNLLLGTMTGWALAYTRGLGLLSFSPKNSFHLISSWGQFMANAHTYLAALGVFFPVLRTWAWNHMAGAVFAIISLFLAFHLVRHLAGHAITLSARQAMITGFFLVSILVMSAAFLILAVDRGDYRYLVNIYYGLLALGVFIFAWQWRAMPVFSRWAVCLWVFIFIAAGAASGPAAWENRVEINDNGALALAGFLEQNDLHYGYGDYWAAPANTISWISGYRVVVRPVSLEYDPGANPAMPLFFMPRRHEISAAWFGPGNSANQRRFFLILGMNGRPFEVVSKENVIGQFNYYSLLALAEEQFGRPDETLAFENHIILVWDHPIVQALPQAASAV